MAHSQDYENSKYDLIDDKVMDGRSIEDEIDDWQDFSTEFAILMDNLSPRHTGNFVE